VRCSLVLPKHSKEHGPNVEDLAGLPRQHVCQATIVFTRINGTLSASLVLMVALLRPLPLLRRLLPLLPRLLHLQGTLQRQASSGLVLMSPVLSSDKEAFLASMARTLSLLRPMFSEYDLPK
jgi:hypothetical protein